MKISSVIVLMLVSLSQSTTLNVPVDYPTIQSAISAAVNGDTVLVGPGTYKEQISFIGKNIVVRSALGPGATRIYSLWFNPTAVYFTNGEDSTAVLEGFTINNTGSDHPPVDDEPLPQYGGGIYIEDSSPTIRNNVIQYCVADMCGGGVYCFNSSPTLEGNTIEGCFAEHAGGGFYAQYDLGTKRIRLISNTISDNVAFTYGGGIYVYDALFVEMSGNVISGNDDRGIYVSQVATLAMLGNKIYGNTSGDNGGGVYVNSTDALTVIGNVISDNTAHTGGGMSLRNAYATITNNSICNNVATGSNYGTGGFRATECDYLNMQSTIVWGNAAPNGTVQNFLVYETFIDIAYSNIQGGLDSIWADSLSVINWGEGNIDIDPLFEVGPLSDFHLSEASPCIDTGNPAPEYNDPEDPFNPGYALWPAMGYLGNDMGAYGGRGVDYILSVEEEEGPSTPDLLLRSYPNPFTSSCTISFGVPEAGLVSLDVYDLAGRRVRTLYEGEHPSGGSSALFDGSDLPSGVYVVVFRSSGQVASQRCVLVR